MSHTLPSADHLADFTAHFKRSVFNRDGGAEVTFSLAADQLPSLLDLQRGDGMALNLSVWGTQIDDGDSGLAGLMGLLGGLGTDDGGEGSDAAVDD